MNIRNTKEEKKIFFDLFKFESRSMHGQLPIIWKKAKNHYIYDIHGRKIIDFTSTIFVASVGHANANVIKSISKTLKNSLLHTYAYPHKLRSEYIKKLVKFFGKRDGPVSFSLSLDPSLFSWGLSFLSNCRHDRYLKNAKTLRDLATYSRSTLQWLTEEQQINYDLCSTGILAIHKSIQSLEEAALESDQLDNTDNQEEVLDAYQCARLEPALTDAVDSGIIAGGIFSKNAATGNARSFTLELAKKCAELGVCFTFGVNIVGIVDKSSSLSEYSGIPVFESIDELEVLDAIVITDLGDHQASLKHLSDFYPGSRIFLPQILNLIIYTL